MMVRSGGKGWAGSAKAVLALVAMTAFHVQADDAPASAPAAEATRTWAFGATPIWQDEFDYEGLPDPARWSYDIGGNGWGNEELQYYTDQLANAFVGDGLLTIVARKQRAGRSRFTSARLVSRDKGDFLYGRIELRARLPVARGTWPALWMLPPTTATGIGRARARSTSWSTSATTRGRSM